MPLPADPADTKKLVRIAVIGGGAKAVALAARASVLRELGHSNIEVTIYEEKQIGAHWSGTNGYTDGEQRLCTSPLRDLGFPYSSMDGDAVDIALRQKFSWQSYLQTSSRQAYSRWVDGGGLPPKHSEFAKYLQWAGAQSKAKVEHATVKKLRTVGDKWQILSRPSKRERVRSVWSTEFDGVVATGTGPARMLKPNEQGPRIFNGVDFWQRRGQLKKLCPKPDPDHPIVIVGAGGTAAAILAWLTRNGYRDHNIYMIADQAALFTRGDSFFENRLFSEDEAWQELSVQSRVDFVSRLNRGVVWGTVMSEVSTATKLVIINGRAAGPRKAKPKEKWVTVDVTKGNGQPFEAQASVLIDASGFRNWWFLDLIEALPVKQRSDREFLKELEAEMEQGLYFRDSKWKLPRLHAPMVSSAVGPGLVSLMSLGAMAERILRTYSPS